MRQWTRSLCKQRTDSSCHAETLTAYLLKEEFELFWECASPTWAAKYIDTWCTRAMRSRIEPVKKFARTVRDHRKLLLNYFRAKKQFSSGVIEGLNSQSHHEKSVWLSNVTDRRTLSISRARQAS